MNSDGSPNDLNDNIIFVCDANFEKIEIYNMNVNDCYKRQRFYLFIYDLDMAQKYIYFKVIII